MKNTRPTLTHRLRPAVVLAVLAALLLVPRAFAADATWNVDAAGSWSNSANWSGGVIPGATNTTDSADVATFGINVTANRTISVDANRNIGGITFNHTSSVSGNAYTVGSVRLSDGGVIQQINSTGANTNSVGSTVYIQGDGGSATFRNTTSGGNNRLIINDARGVSTAGNTTTLYLDGISTSANMVSSTISDGTGGGNLAIIKDGAGTWRLNGNNTYSGGTTVNAGTLQFTNNNSFGTGVITLGSATNSATLTLSTGGTFTMTNKIVAAGNFQLNGRSDATLTYSGDMDLGGVTRTITTGGVDSVINISGAISNGALTKRGATTLTLQGDNIYTGNTTVEVGTLALEAGSGSALGATAAVTVNSNATLLIAKSDQINNSASITLSGGTITRASGVSEAMGDLTLTAASTLNYGGGTEGALTFGAYTPSSLLTVNNFFEGNKLVFASDLTSAITNSSYFAFDNGFTTKYEGGLFTITAIPEASTLAAAAGLLGLLLCPMLRRRTS